MKTLSPKELKSAAIAMFKKQTEPFFATSRELYEYLCYVLGAHYWSCEYLWENVA